MQGDKASAKDYCNDINKKSEKEGEVVRHGRVEYVEGRAEKNKRRKGREKLVHLQIVRVCTCTQRKRESQGSKQTNKHYAL